ncbi:hypothetical protein V490_01227 [Pseudogymnoascus sp. VKM F-3557]|nr:hypothetical protein V490_01227 [Pseudogymnoascus sp. VKM F-3557]
MNPSRPETQSQWHFIGPTSSFPDIESPDGANLSQARACDVGGFKPGCKAFYVSTRNEDGARGGGGGEGEKKKGLVEADLDEAGSPAANLKSQILVFKYKGKFHAVDHQCPHSSYPLSRGTLFDIEDFGVVLSAGLTCPKHDWSFDLFTGTGDRGNYKLRVWDVEVRRGGGGEEGEKEVEGVWVRRKKVRMG